jgi:hypothetical protein
VNTKNTVNCAATPALLLVSATLLAAPRPASAGLTGFSDFAPMNATQEDPSQPTYNGYYGDTFQLTAAGITGQATSGFAQTKQSIANFTAKFTYLATYGGPPADGVGFVLQNDPRGLTALGGGGGSIGYSSGGGGPITNSAGVMFSAYYADPGANSFASGGTITGWYYNSPANIRNQYPVDVTVTYFGNTLAFTLRDPVSGRIASRSTTLDLAAALGGSTAYVGFTGSTGGYTATQNVSNFSFTNTVGAYTPVKVHGFTQDVIVEKGATDFQTAVTATLDNGTARNTSNQLSGATFYEKGFNTTSATTGLPSAGDVVSTDGVHAFSVAAATGPNALLLNASSTSGTLTFDTPTAYPGLSFLVTTGNGSGTFDVRVKHSDGAADEVFTFVAAPDWFGGGPVGINANGRVNPDLATDNVGAGNPRLYAEDILLADTDSPISSIDFTYSGGAGNTYIFGVSGLGPVPVPEPATTALLAATATVFLVRRRPVTRA